MCMPYSTPIWTSNGSVLLGDIVKKRLDPLVRTFSHDDILPAWHKIANLHEFEARNMLCVTLVGGKKVFFTPKQSVFVLGDGYVRASKVRQGDLLVLLDRAFGTKPRPKRVYSVKSCPKLKQSVFALSVHVDKNYFADGILVS